MSSRNGFVAALLLMLILSACGRNEESAHAGEAGEAMAAAEFERGPHRGRMLRDGAFALELQIFEEGVPPEYHIYLFHDDKPLPLAAATVTVDLKRLDGEVNHFQFKPEGDFLRGQGVVHEPHSFSVTVNAVHEQKAHTWAFDSFEGRTTIAAAKAEEAGVRTESAGPVTLAETVTLTGRLVANAERVRTVSARFAGVIRSVGHSVGDAVKAGERLATIESNESLETYALIAPIAGVITARHANPGENTTNEPLFELADYDSLWADLNLFPRDLARVKKGQKVKVSSVDGDREGEGTVIRIVPLEGGNAGSIYIARVLIDNKDRSWTPGLFVEGAVQIGTARVPLAVKRSGLQGFRDFTVVFEQIGETYEVRMLELGRQDDTYVEVLGGLKPGARYVTENSYLIKADVEKSGASHDH
jgi:cobalt-zinc-cadmium efflux system membrane fusion protein